MDWESEAFGKLIAFTCDTGVIRFGAEPEFAWSREYREKHSMPPLRNEHTIYASMCKKPTENQVNTLKRAVSDVRLFNKGGGDVELRMETIGTKDLCHIVVPNPTQESVDKFLNKCFNQSKKVRR